MPEEQALALRLLTDVLVKVREQFQFYGDSHLSKNPPQIAKAAVNYKFVAEINQALITAQDVMTPPDRAKVAGLDPQVENLLKSRERTASSQRPEGHFPV